MHHLEPVHASMNGMSAADDVVLETAVKRIENIRIAAFDISFHSPPSPHEAHHPPSSPRTFPTRVHHSTEMPKQDKRVGTTIAGYYVEEMIGWGATSKVYRGSHTLTKQRVAIKVLNKPRSRIGDIKRTVTECTILSKLKHPNIVEMSHWFETDKHIYIVMELAKDGDLLELINKHKLPAAEETIKMWFAQIVDALEYTHAQGYVHKDIKPDNILLDGHRVLLADWGFAHEFRSEERHCRLFTGTEGYWAPEVLTHTPFIGPELDCWSLGVSLFALATARLPFDRRSPTYPYDVLQARFVIPSHVSPCLASLIRALLNPDPLARYTISDIQQHPFYTSAMLPRSPPIERISALSSSGSRISPGSEIRNRTRKPTILTTTTKLHDGANNDDQLLPITSTLDELIFIAREPASPPQSAPASRNGSRIGTMRCKQTMEERVDEEPVVVGNKERHEDESVQQQEQSTASPSSSIDQVSKPVRQKEKKLFGPLKSVMSIFSTLKRVPVKIFA